MTDDDPVIHTLDCPDCGEEIRMYAEQINDDYVMCECGTLVELE